MARRDDREYRALRVPIAAAALGWRSDAPPGNLLRTTGTAHWQQPPKKRRSYRLPRRRSSGLQPGAISSCTPSTAPRICRGMVRLQQTMPAHVARGFASCVALSLGAALTVTARQDVPASGGAPLVYAAEVDSVIHPVSAEYMIETMNQADRTGATLVVFTLRTPGGLVDSTRSIVSRMIAGKTPVAVFVGPAGARAASAGFFLTIAADIAAMAPGTHIGAAHPVAAGGEKMDETMAKKAAEDVAAYARTLAGNRHRNATLAALAVTESRAFTEEEALGASPPLIDLVAVDVPD